ncbi:hypothetical protein L1I30_12515 [Gillisia sp. M10.2A]|uniref:Uncharacterized protein n=1 Tax=Gillisia lutea TaxID=2909668 RepID=A0ABS9EKY1_9FLAO|nr:hypothetical protein [Gillisia lutea]MCF4102494.1 hypothetical protein [Gillisia lutea]
MQYFYACESEGRSLCCVNIDTAVSIKFVNAEGRNLFDPEEGIYTAADVNIFYKKAGEWKAYYNGNMDASKGFSIIEIEDESYLQIFPSDNIIDNSYSETKLEFSNGDQDILKVAFNLSDNNTLAKKVWYNEILKYEVPDGTRYFTILKE